MDYPKRVDSIGIPHRESAAVRNDKAKEAPCLRGEQILYNYLFTHGGK
jgi:hypothetical protein